MSDSRFNNNVLGGSIKKAIELGYTLKAGTIGGYSIEEVETCTSYIYYGDIDKRDADLKLAQKLIKENEK